MNINDDTREFCMPGWALVRFNERHVTLFGPIAFTYFIVR